MMLFSIYLGVTYLMRNLMLDRFALKFKPLPTFVSYWMTRTHSVIHHVSTLSNRLTTPSRSPLGFSPSVFSY
jgi:hypothetical protein